MATDDPTCNYDKPETGNGLMLQAFGVDQREFIAQWIARAMECGADAVHDRPGYAVAAWNRALTVDEIIYIGSGKRPS